MHEPPRGSPAEASPPATRARAAPEEAFEPAPLDAVRSLRRWLLVTGAWAVAATAIGTIALIAATRDSDDDIRAATGRIEQVRRGLSARVGDLEERVGELARADDVSRLENRLRAVEDQAERSSQRLRALDTRLGDLEEQVDRLERTPSGEAGDGSRNGDGSAAPTP